jgi:AcrR family transcriptional regulator
VADRKNTGLDRARVAGTALDLLNEVGLEGLTVRLIAARLGVKAPALYWHFKDKQALLDEMATEITRRLAAEAGPLAPGADWRDVFRGRQCLLRDHLLRYRDGARVYSGTRFTDTGYAAPMEVNLRLLVDAGFTPRAAARAWFTAYAYTIGFVIEEQAMAPFDPGEVEARTERLADFPLAAQAGPELFGDADAGFRRGLDVIVAGLVPVA